MAPTPRPLCPRCQRPLRACVCAFVVATHNRLPLLVLQHPAETAHAKSSLRLLRLGLSLCQVQVGVRFEPAQLAGWLGDTGSGWLVFPAAPGAVPAGQHSALPRRLVLLDGNWRQARALLQANPLLQALPRWALPAPPPSRYAIRRAQRPEQRSTLEAACLALGALEGRPAHYAPLLDAFSAWVATMATTARTTASTTVPTTAPITVPTTAQRGNDPADARTAATMPASANPSLAA